MDQLAVLAAVVHLISPNGAVSFDLDRADSGALTYAVSLDRHPVVTPSAIGIVVDGRKLGERVEVGKAEAYAIDESYPWRGVHTPAVARCRGARIALTDIATRTGWSIDARACDDGAAFRYIVPGESTTQRVPDEATEFRLPPSAIVWSHDFEGHYEGTHVRREVAAVPDGLWAAPPLTIKLPGGAGYASITESALAAYAGMGLRGDGKNGFAAKLGHEQPVSYPYRLRYRADDVTRLSKPAAIAGTITTPWRVVIAGRTLNALVNADIVHNLAPPPDPKLFADTSWIKPGRAVWRYLDGGENTYDGLIQFNTLAQRLGFEYHVVEGIWQRWTDAQLRAFMDDAKQKGIGIWLWKSSQMLTTPADQRAFLDQARAVGAVGAKIDFFDHEAKEMIDRYQSLLREAAERRIMLNFHGANKPTGESRTWPNELTRESVLGFEHRGTWPWGPHNTTLPFTRFLAGPADFTPVVFGDERRKDTSWAHQIATAIVFTSPLLVYGANPESLLANPAVDIIKAIPSVWDETIVLPASEIGEVAGFARRSGRTWFVAVLNGPAARNVTIDLSFLPAGAYDAIVGRDRSDAAGAIAMERSTITSGGSLSVDLRAGGGFIARLTPQ